MRRTRESQRPDTGNNSYKSRMRNFIFLMSAFGKTTQRFLYIRIISYIYMTQERDGKQCCFCDWEIVIGVYIYIDHPNPQTHTREEVSYLPFHHIKFSN